MTVYMQLLHNKRYDATITSLSMLFSNESKFSRRNTKRSSD